MRARPASTPSRVALGEPALCAWAASGAPAAPSALDRQPSSRRLIAPRGSDVSRGIGLSRAPIQIPAPFPRSAPPSLTMASAFTASAPRGQGSASSALRSVRPASLDVHNLAFLSNLSDLPARSWVPGSHRRPPELEFEGRGLRSRSRQGNQISAGKAANRSLHPLRSLFLFFFSFLPSTVRTTR